MAWPDDPLPAIREEVHFGGRRVRCFADRPASVPAVFEAALERNPEGEALVAADRAALLPGALGAGPA